MFVYESVPGTAVANFNCTSEQVSFTVEGKEDAMVTLELEPETDYEITVDGASAGQMKTNLGGKLNLSVEFNFKIFLISINAFIMLTLTLTAISLFNKAESIAIPCSVKTYGSLFLFLLFICGDKLAPHIFYF